jgi:hypothetical protein
MSSQSTTVAKFSAEIKKVSGRTSASGDKVYQLVLESWDPGIMNVGVLDSQVLVDVEVRVQDGAE